MSKQDTITTLLGLLTQNGYVQQGEPDEYSVTFLSKDGTHRAIITGSGINFTSVTNVEHNYSYGFSAAHLQDVRALLRNRVSFTEEAFAQIKADQEKAKKPWQKRKESGGSTVKTPGTPKGPSVRSTIFELLDAGKDTDGIHAELIKAFPDQDAKKLKARIYIHRSEWNKKG